MELNNGDGIFRTVNRATDFGFKKKNLWVGCVWRKKFNGEEGDETQVSHEKNPSYFPWNPGWLIGILIMDYYNPYITG